MSGATSRIAHWCGGRSPISMPHSTSAQRVAGVQRPVAAAADVGGTAPIGELIRGRGGDQDLTGCLTSERRPYAGQRIRIVRAVKQAVLHAGTQDTVLARHMPGSTARIAHLSHRRKPQLADRGPCDHTLPLGGVHPHDEIHTVDLQYTADHIGAQRLALAFGEQVDHRGTLGGADGDVLFMASLRAGGLAGRSDAELRQLLVQRDRVLDRHL